jgi:hypothetical protein
VRDGRSDGDDDVVSDDEDGPITSVMSVVSGGLVLVIVEVVVDGASVVDDESENGVRYSRGAGSVVVACRTTNIVNHTIRPMAASAATLAASRVGVRSCHLGSPVTATDSSPGSIQLPDDLRGEERQVVEIGHIQNLQVDPLDSGTGEGAQLVHDLVGGARHR